MKVLFVCSANGWRGPMAEALLKKNRPACMRFKYTRKNLEERGARKILGEVNQRKDTVASIVKRRGYSKTRVTKALRHLGYTVHKDGTFD